MPRTCPFCRSAVDYSDETVSCPECKIIHHKECWEENSGCARYGCEGHPEESEKIVIRTEDLQPSSSYHYPGEDDSDSDWRNEPIANEGEEESTDWDGVFGCLFWAVIIFFILRSCS